MEQRTETDIASTLSRLEARVLIDNSPRYKGLSPEQREALAEQIRENPEQSTILQQETGSINTKEVNSQLNLLQERLAEAKSAYENAWMPEQPEAFYTSGEHRSLQLRIAADEWLGPLIGVGHAEAYRQSLAIEARSRYREHIEVSVSNAVKQIHSVSERLESTLKKEVESFLQYQQEVVQHDGHLAIAQDRLVEIAVQQEEARKSSAEYGKQGDLSKVREINTKIMDLRGEETFYRRSKRESVNAILLRKKLLNRIHVDLGRIAPLAEQVQEFSGELELVAQSLKLYQDDQHEFLDPGAFQELSNVYQTSRSVLEALDEAFVKHVDSITEAMPQQLVTPYNTKEVWPDTRTTTYTRLFGEREEEARSFAAEARTLHIAM